jgi:hypothetical protein
MLLGIAPASKDAKLGLGAALIGLKKYTEAATIARYEATELRMELQLRKRRLIFSGLLQDNSEDIDGLLLRARAFYYKGEPWATVNPFLVNILTLDPDNKEAADLRRVRARIGA